MRRGGFTLLELLLVLLLISFVAAAVIPAYFSRSDVTLENAAVLLAKDLRAAQNRSAFMGEATVVEFLPDGDGYRVLTKEGRPVDNPRNELPFERRYSIDGVFRGVVIREVHLEHGRRLEYDDRGEPKQAGRIVLTFGNDTRVITVNPPYGHIAVLGTSSGFVDLGY